MIFIFFIVCFTNTIFPLLKQQKQKYNQEWNDVNLRWNSTEFGNVTDLRIPPHRIWKPDVLMYNR